MAKTEISQFDLVPANNTDIGGIDIRGTANVQNFDDAFRTLMAYERAEYDKTSTFMRTVLDDADAVAARATLGIGWEKILDVSFASSLGVVQTGLSAYRKLRITARLYPLGAETTFYAQVSSDGGATWLSGAASYETHRFTSSSAGSAGTAESFPGIPLTSGALVSVDGNAAAIIQAQVEPFGGSSQNVRFRCDASGRFSGGEYITGIGGRGIITTARNAIRIIPASGSMAGAITIEGIRT